MTFRVVATGMQTLLEDLGRPGYAGMGVTASGAFDRAALRRGNRILGNRTGAAGLEVLLGGLKMRAASNQLLCVTGAVGATDIDGRPITHERPAAIKRGQVLSLGAPTVGLRTYIAVRGGFDADPTLGSRSTDTLSQLGPSPVAAGDWLRVGRWTGTTAPTHDEIGKPDTRLGAGTVSLRILFGPHDGWFEPAAADTLLQEAWIVGSKSNRIGIRAEGPVFRRSRTGELPTTPCIRGAIQVTADGQPIIFGPDHPVTGGYPVIAAVIDADTDLLGQARAGQVLRFTRHRP